jgi:predicted TIM-barrel fold metal-dependent hydrolase
MQGFYPNDRMAYPLYEAINDGGAIALFHTGQTRVGSGPKVIPGGDNFLEYAMARSRSTATRFAKQCALSGRARKG